MKKEVKLLSIIVPAYNVEKYLSILIDSLLAKKEIIDKLEIIVVNDGSSDNTLRIANDYLLLYPNTIIVIDKENGGHGSGINVGIDIATGKYLKVIDSDDWVNEDGLLELIEAIKVNDVDVFVNPYNMVWESGINKIVDYGKIEKNKKFTFAEYNKQGYLIPLHAFTLRSSIAKNKIPKIDEKIFYDDIEFVLYPVPHISTIIALKESLYCYRLGRVGQSVELKSYVKNIKHFEKMFDSISKYYETNLRNHENDAASSYYLHMVHDMLSKLCDIYLYIGSKEAKGKLVSIFKKYDYINIKTIKSKKIKLLLMSKGHLFDVLSVWMKRKMSKNERG